MYLSAEVICLYLRGHTQQVRSVAFSPDGPQVVTGSDDRTARIWEVGSGHELICLRDSSSRFRSVASVAFSPNGRQVLTGGAEAARVWDISTGRKLISLLLPDGAVSCATFSPDGRLVLTGFDSGIAILSKVSNGRDLVWLEENHTDEVVSVAFSPDGQHAITCDGHGLVFFWRLLQPKRCELFAFYVALSRVLAIHWEDPTHLVLADNGGSRGRPSLYHLELEGL